MGRGNNSSRGIATRPRNSAGSGQFCWPLPTHSSFIFFPQSRDRGYISLTYTYPIPGRDSLRKSQLIMANLPHPHLSPRGSLLLSDIVINRGITRRPPISPSPARSLTALLELSISPQPILGGGKGVPWDGGSTWVSGIGRDMDILRVNGEEYSKTVGSGKNTYHLQSFITLPALSVSHLCRASCRGRTSRVPPTSFASRRG